MAPEGAAMALTAGEIRLQRRMLRTLGFALAEEIDGAAAPADEAQPAAAEAPRPAPAPPAPGAASLGEVAGAVRTCTRCALEKSRRHPVVGHGAARARLMFVGEWPEEADDAEGAPFCGELGELFANMVRAMGLERGAVYSTLAVKCRAPGGRPARPAEIGACRAHLAAEVALVQPEVIVALGDAALEALVGAAARPGLRALRGQWMDHHGIAVMPTYSLGYIHRNKPRKRDVWTDLQEVMRRLGLPLPPVK
jgi:DNA polymerase